MLQRKMAEELGILAGDHIHFAGSLHLYEKQFAKVEEMLNERNS
jgi:thymidylate synthase